MYILKIRTKSENLNLLRFKCILIVQIDGHNLFIIYKFDFMICEY